MTSADITSALQIVERYKFQGTPSVEYLQANAQQHFLNLMGDGEEMAVRKKKKKKKKKKTVTELQKAHAAMKRDPFGDLRKYVAYFAAPVRVCARVRVIAPSHHKVAQPSYCLDAHFL